MTATPPTYACAECGRTYVVPSLAADCARRHIEDREESA